MSESNSKIESDAAVFVPIVKKVDIAGETFTVKKFTLRKWIEVSREVVQFIGGVMKKVAADNPNADVDSMPWQMFLPYAWEELYRLAPILGAAIDRDAEWILDQDDMKGITQLLNTIIEINDFKELVVNFTETFRNLKEQFKEVENPEPSENAST